MNHELNMQIAREVVGWIVQRDGSEPIYVTELPPDGEPWVEAWLPVPDFSGSLDAAFEMEEEIERRGLRYVYARELQSEIHPGHWPSGNSVNREWRLIHATPEQRCQAALSAVSFAEQTAVRTEALEAAR